MPRALLLIAHGSRRQEANDDLRWAADELGQRLGDWIVQPAYLELAEPDIPGGAARCVEQGADAVLLLPCFLSPGRHVHADLEQFRQELSRAHPRVTFQLGAPIGRHPLLLEILLQRAREAVGGDRVVE